MLMNHIVENLGVIGSAPSGGFAKATIKARLFKFFCKEGDQNQTGVPVVAPSGSIYGNPTLQN
jgi:hypothetical protein